MKPPLYPFEFPLLFRKIEWSWRFWKGKKERAKIRREYFLKEISFRDKKSHRSKTKREPGNLVLKGTSSNSYCVHFLWIPGRSDRNGGIFKFSKFFKIQYEFLLFVMAPNSYELLQFVAGQSVRMYECILFQRVFVLGRKTVQFWGISADTALQFSKFFGNSVEFWMRIQDEFEIREERSKISAELKEIRTYKELLGA